MNEFEPHEQRSGRSVAFRFLAVAFASMAMIVTPLKAAQTDISSTPITSSSSAQVKPNIMLLMDTSDSMRWTHMPDEVESVVRLTSVGYKAFQCNVLSYNPTISYIIPRKADGTPFTTPSFTAALYDAYDTTSPAPLIDLSQNFQAWSSPSYAPWATSTVRLASGSGFDPAQPAYYYVYTGGPTAIANYNDPRCQDADPYPGTGTFTSSGGGTWTKVIVSSNSGPGATDERLNFATWYNYYRIRMAMTKSAASLAFTPLTDSFRVGFITMNPKFRDEQPASASNPDLGLNAAVNPQKFLPVNDFNSTQRNLWFNKLFSQKAGGTSPAREGLARVGRYYGGKTDGINTGMGDGSSTGGADPVQYSCQQNFTIMTTDGYWNDNSESVGAGPVKLDGVTPVGNQDGVLTPPSGNSPRPIWDGVPDGKQTTTAKLNTYGYAPCGAYFYKTETQVSQSTSQTTQSTSQTTQSTVQNLQSTQQVLRSQVQNLQATSQPTQSTSQNLQSTQQNLANTRQRLQSTLQTTQSTNQNLQSTNQNLQSTNQNLQISTQNVSVKTWVDQFVRINRQSTVQNLQSTTQRTQSTSQTTRATQQNLQSTTQPTRSTQQNLQSTTQTTQSTSQTQRSQTQNLTSTTQTLQSTTQTTRSTQQTLTSTHQVVQSTTQTTLSTSQARQTTTQDFSCPTSGEACTPVASNSCTQTAANECTRQTDGPRLVASCTPQSANAGNNYVTTTCQFNNTGPTAVASCTQQAAGPGNSYTATTCNTNTNSSVPVASCNPASANNTNAYTATTCSANDTGPTASQSCTPASAGPGNSYTQTTCSSNNSGPTGVSSCSPVTATSGNSWTTTTCSSNNTGPTPVASCTPGQAGSGNSWTATTCAPNNTSSVPTSTCSPSGPTSGNGYTTTTCSSNNTSNVPVASCTPQSGSAGNSWVTVTCPVATTGPTGVPSCTPSGPTVGNSYTTTSCGNGNTSNVPVASCSASGANSGNGYTTTTCPAPVVTGPTPVASCAPQTASSGNSWTTATCGSNDTNNVPVAACTPSGPTLGNNYTTTTCPAPVTTGPTPVASCSTVAASSGNSWVATTCPVLVSGPTGVSSCNASGPTSGNSYTTTTCGNNNTSNVPVASCSSSSGNPGNSYTNTTCSNNNTSNVAVASCTASGATSGNGWTTTTCPTPTAVSGPTRVASCSPSPGTPGNGYQETYCQNGSAEVPSGTCVPEGPNAGNNYVTTTCNANVTGPVPVLSCTPQPGNAGNGYTTITCPAPNQTTNVPVATCTASPATSGNSWTSTTCPTPNKTSNVPVATCTPATAGSGNSYTTTTCSANTTGPTGVASCASIPAGPGNSYTSTTCGNNNTTNVPVASCTGSGPGIGNGYTTTSCSNNNQNNVPVASCSPQLPVIGNAYTTTTCPAPATTTNVPVASCVVQPAAAGNSWTATTCSTNNSGPTPVSSCTPVGPVNGNGYTTTSCGSNNSLPTGVASCTPSGPTLGNNWTTTTCSTNNASNVPVSSCVPQLAGVGNAWTGVTCTPVNTTNVAVASCSASPGTGANNWVTTTCSTNNTTNVPSGSCSPVSPTPGNGYTTTTCPIVTSGPTGVALCLASSGNVGNGYTTTTCNTVNSGPTPVASCSVSPASPFNSWTATACPTVITGPVVTTTCTSAGANSGNGFTSTLCTPTSGQKIQYVTTTTVDVTYYSSGLPSRSDATITTTSGPTDVDGVCYPPATLPPALPTPNPQPANWTTADATSFPSCTAWPCSVSQALGGARSVNSLADVAQYYYVTDLRASPAWPANISTDDVPAVGSGPEDDRVRWQHMTTFTVALGVSGTLTYRPDYKRGTTTTGDFAEIRNGTKNWPLWPDPSLDYSIKSNWNDLRSIDDFWHAAVNGRGTYFSAGNPTSVIAGLQEALAGISARLASASGAGVSNLEPVAGDNLIYLANYTTQKWTGDVQAKEIDLASGSILPTVIWSAQAKLDPRTSGACDDRKIKLFRAGAPTDNLVNFTWNTKACDGSGNPTGSADTGLNNTEQGYFGAAAVSPGLSQWPSLTDGTSGTVNQRALAVNENLVNYLRGQNGRAVSDFTPDTTDKVFRLRDHVLGDTVNGQPTYVRSPFASYGDAGYAAYKLAQSGRTPMLYVPANDGMLHAFYAGTGTTDPNGGKEAWAFIPSTVLPKLYKLADNNYKNNHAFFVDGTPTVTDIFDAGSNSWKTVLSAGLNDGGKGYYALDITDPVNPKGMWEFKWDPAVCPSSPGAAAGNAADCHLGYTFGRPVTSKLADGTWVTMVTSGYNNVNAPSQAGDGQGYLYVLNATTGRIRYKIPTNVGDPTTPSGLAQINAFVDKADTSNLAVRVYGTDVLGNVWRFDVNDNLAPTGREATLLGTAKDTLGNRQPITIRPELSELNGQPMVFVGTGRLLGASDVSDLQPQSVYGIVDPLTGSPSFANLRTALAPLTLTQVGSGAGTYRTVACTGSAAQCSSAKGWVVNLPDSGERVNVEMKLTLGTLVVGSNIPQISACTSGGYSWLSYFNFKSGLALPPGNGSFAGNANNAVSEQIANSLIVGLTVVKLPGVGSPPFTVYVTGSNAEITRHDGRVSPPNGGGKRVSWREVLSN